MCVVCNKRSVKKTTNKKSNCKHLHSLLTKLDLKVLDKYDEIEDTKLLKINKLLLTWIKGLRDECPPEDQLNTIKNILSNEYSIS